MGRNAGVENAYEIRNVFGMSLTCCQILLGLKTLCDLPPQLGIGLLEGSIDRFQPAFVDAPAEFGTGSHREDPENLEVNLAPIAFAPVKDGQMTLDLALLVAQGYGKETLRTDAREPRTILWKHLLDVAWKCDDFVIQHALARRAGQAVYERIAIFPLAPVSERTRLVCLGRYFGNERTGRIQRLRERADQMREEGDAGFG